MPNIQSYLHTDTLNGRQITLAVNQPITALESKGWRLARRLHAFLRSTSGRFLLVHEGLAWSTERPAVVVGAQCLAWSFEGKVTLLCWPLDNSVYFGQVESSGFNLITPDTELVCSYNDALAMLQQSREQIVIVSGGVLTDMLESVGYSANADSRQQLSDSSRYRTRAPLRVYTRLRLPHPGHAGIPVLMLLFYLLYVLLSSWINPPEEDGQVTVVTVVPAMGQAKLAPALHVLRRRLRDIEVLTLYGLQRIEYHPDSATMELSGETTPQRWPRLETVLRQFKVVPETTGREWQISLTEPFPQVPEQNLIPINVELIRILRLALEAGLTAEIIASRSIGGSISVKNGGRFRTRRSTEIEMELRIPAAGVATSLPVLVAHLATMQPTPSLSLQTVRIDVAPDGSKDARMTIIIQGSPAGVAI